MDATEAGAQDQGEGDHVSVNYMAIAGDARGVGVTLFHQGAASVTSGGDGVMVLGLGRGHLRLAGYVASPCGDRRDAVASFAQALAIRAWFRAQPFVGGGGIPEEFIIANNVFTTPPALASALMMAWHNPDDDALTIDLAKRGGRRWAGWLHVVPTPNGSVRRKVLSRLATDERDVLQHPRPVRPAVIMSAYVGLVHLGRLEVK